MPRETPAPHQPHKDNATDVLALWRCDEAAGAAFTDVRGAFTTTLGTLPGAAGGLFVANPGATGARVFNGSTHFASAPGSSPAHSVFAPTVDGQGYTIEAWVSFAAVNVEQTILAYGGSGTDATQANNTLVSFRLNSSGKLRVFWEHGAGVDVTQDAGNMAALAASTVYHVALTVRRRLFSCDVEFSVNDVLVDRYTGLTAADGGTTSPLFVIGRHSDTGEATAFLNGTLDDVRVLKFAASAALVRDSYARGVRNFDYATMYGSGSWATHLWVYAEWTGAAVADFDRGVGYLDLDNIFGHRHVLGVTDGEDVDNQGAQATVRLVRNFSKQNLGLNFAYGALNDASFLAVMRRVKIEKADVPIGYSRDAAKIHRQTVFEGVVRAHAWPTNELELTLADRIRGLQIAWCKRHDDGTGVQVEQQFCVGGDLSMELVAQAYLDNFKPAGGYKVNDNDQSSGAITAYFPAGSSGSSFNIQAHGVMNKSVAQAVDDLVTQIGWRARMRFDDFRKEYRYTIYEPNRAATWTGGTDVDLTNAMALEWTELALDDESIRNKIEVDHLEASTTDNTGESVRFLAEASDAPSISTYGERYAEIGIGSTRNISDAASGQKLANAVLADLKDPKATGVVSVLHHFGLDIEDMVRARADGQRFAVDTDFAIVATQNKIENGARRTELTVRNGSPIGGWKRHFDRHIGQKGHIAARGRAAVIAPVAPTVVALAEGLVITWTKPVGAGNRRYKETEVHVSTSTGFTPDNTTILTTTSSDHFVAKNLARDTLWYVKLVHRDENNNHTTASAQSSATVRYLPKAPGFIAEVAADYNPGGGKGVAHFNQPDLDNFGNYNGSTFTFTAPRSGLYIFTASVKATDTSSNSIQLEMDFTRNGGAVFDQVVSGGATGTTMTDEIEGVVHLLNSGDTVKVFVTQGNNATGNFRIKNDGVSTYFSGFYISGAI